MAGDDDFGQSDGIVTPVPEDPNVAVSYSLGADSSRVGSESDGADAPPSEPLADAASDSRPAIQRPVSAPDGPADESATGDADTESDLETRKTRRMPAVQLQELGLSENTSGGGKGGGDESIDIPIDEDEPETADEGDPGSARAATVALSDEDLEELIEPMEVAGEHRAAEPTSSPGAASGRSGDDLDVRATQPLPVLDQQSAHLQVSAKEPGGKRSTTSPPPEPGGPKPPEPSGLGVPAAVAALESAGMESPMDERPLRPEDPGDSGELLSDELIEEVDDSDVEVADSTGGRASPPPAPPAAAAPAKKPPPAPSSSAAKSQEPSGPAPKRRKGKPWFEEIFDEDYLRTLPFLTPQSTQAEAAFVAGALDVAPGSQLLDIGCGYGRHAMELAARGFQVIALDLSLPLLLRGADEAQRRGLNINFVHGDMRELNFDSQFDGAYCLFSTFGYFDDEANKKTAQGLARALKPGARLVIQILNRDYLIADLPARVWWEGDGCVVLEEVDFNYFASRIVSNRSVVFDDGRQLEQEISMRAYSLHEFGKLLHNVGFRVIEISGSMATRGRFFGNKSREIIVIAEKRADAETRAATQPESYPRPVTSSDAGEPG